MDVVVGVWVWSQSLFFFSFLDIDGDRRCRLTLPAFISFCSPSRRVACFPDFAADWLWSNSFFEDDMVDPLFGALGFVIKKKGLNSAVCSTLSCFLA